ncbi:MAG: hypothetical protein MZW92_02860 [Comamonadaceae bacterium]|nr:hypothetical protein [Comamonadaceae bacterium]
MAYMIDIRFDDQSTDVIEYPSTDVQILTVEDDDAFVKMEDGSRVVAYEASLADLAAGDLVDGHYQDGTENDSWFRGRIAAVNPATNTCDVIYFDKDVSFTFLTDVGDLAVSLTFCSCCTPVRKEYSHCQDEPVQSREKTSQPHVA